VRWELPHPRTVENLPHPSVHLVFEAPSGRGEVAGVPSGRFTTTLHDTGRVFGVKFRPGAFEPLLRAPVSRLTDRRVPIDALFGDAGGGLARALSEVRNFDEACALAEGFLRPRLRPLAPELVRLRELVERLAGDHTLLRVEQAAVLADLDVRTLQRRFRQYVGVSPKWVIQRYRLHEAAERLKAANPPQLALLAYELGYADQAHFTRDFTAVVGRSPATFERAEAVPSGMPLARSRRRGAPSPRPR
jgi:AraC-like DNA-binding protein